MISRAETTLDVGRMASMLRVDGILLPEWVHQTLLHSGPLLGFDESDIGGLDGRHPILLKASELATLYNC